MDGAQQRQCGRKVIYPDSPLAERAAKLMHKRHNGTFTAYACPWCNGWHVGRQRSIAAARRRHEREGQVAHNRRWMSRWREIEESETTSAEGAPKEG